MDTNKPKLGSDEDELLSVADVGTILGVSKPTVYDLLPDDVTRTKQWPPTADSFRSKLDYYMDVLEDKGIKITRVHSGKRYLHVINEKYDNADPADGTVDGADNIPSYVPQIQMYGVDGTTAEERIIKRLDARTNNSKDVP